MEIALHALLLSLTAFLTLGVVNAIRSASFQSDVVRYIQEEVEPLARRQLIRVPVQGSLCIWT